MDRNTLDFDGTQVRPEQELRNAAKYLRQLRHLDWIAPFCFQCWLVWLGRHADVLSVLSIPIVNEFALPVWQRGRASALELRAIRPACSITPWAHGFPASAFNHECRIAVGASDQG